MKVSEATFNSCVFRIQASAESSPEFVDITDQVIDHLRESDIRNGFVVVYSRHTTAAIIIQENEPLLIQDMKSTLERMAPRGAHYRHNDFGVRTVHMHEDECPNGHSHCQHLALGTSEAIPVIDGELALGTYQRVFFVELDHENGEEREILVQVMGM